MAKLSSLGTTAAFIFGGGVLAATSASAESRLVEVPEFYQTATLFDLSPEDLDAQMNAALTKAREEIAKRAAVEKQNDTAPPKPSGDPVMDSQRAIAHACAREETMASSAACIKKALSAIYVAEDLNKPDAVEEINAMAAELVQNAKHMRQLKACEVYNTAEIVFTPASNNPYAKDFFDIGLSYKNFACRLQQGASNCKREAAPSLGARISSIKTTLIQKTDSTNDSARTYRGTRETALDSLKISLLRGLRCLVP